MHRSHHQVTGRQRTIGRYALLVVVLMLIGNVFAFAYLRPYAILRDLGVLAEAREQIQSRYVGEIDDQALLDAAVSGMVDSLGDANTQYLGAKELAYFEEQVGGKFSGIGAEIDIHENRLRIVAPLDDSPAWNSGVLPGDIVLSIDGYDTEGIDIFEAMRRLKGEAGTTVKIRVRHRDGATQDLVITRDTIEVASVRGFRRNPGNGYYYMIDPQRKIAYLRLTQFGDKSYREVQERLAALKQQGMQALILDLRDNGGGLLDAAVAISDLFLTGGKKVVSTQGRADQPILTTSTNQTLLPDTPLVVLVNENSASASEIVAGAIGDNRRGLLVGTRTFGKGSVQQLLPLGDGSSAIKLTTAYWYMPSGRLIHRKEGAEEWGVDPSKGCYVPMDDARVREMLMKRRDSEAEDPFESLDASVTPQWIRQNLLDDQLAAAVQAAQAKVDSGEWVPVGMSLEQATAPLTEAEALERRRQELQDLLKEVDEQLESLNEAPPVEEPGTAEGDD